MFFSKTGKSDAIKHKREYSKYITGLIEAEKIALNNREVANRRINLNRKWLMELEQELINALKRKPQYLEILVEKIFVEWRKNKYSNKYSLAHVHIFDICDRYFPLKVSQLVEAVVFNSYKRYELETGKKVTILRRIKEH